MPSSSWISQWADMPSRLSILRTWLLEWNSRSTLNRQPTDYVGAETKTISSWWGNVKLRRLWRLVRQSDYRICSLSQNKLLLEVPEKSPDAIAMKQHLIFLSDGYTLMRSAGLVTSSVVKPATLLDGPNVKSSRKTCYQKSSVNVLSG